VDNIFSRQPERPYFLQRSHYRFGVYVPQVFRFSERSNINDDGFFENDCAQLVLESYEITKFTRCGYWINVWGKKKFILKSDESGGKRWAYTDPVLAMESYLIRKDHHIAHLKRKLRIAVNARKQARELCPASTSILNPSERSI
jgi:hypothetical protein